MSATVWALSLAHEIGGSPEGLAAALARLSTGLSEAEADRLCGYRRPEDALRFAAGRALVRSLVLDVQDQAAPHPVRAKDIVFGQRRGTTKPVLAEQCRGLVRGVADFNISHDGDWVLAGVAGRGAIGVDVARVFCPEDMGDREYIGEFETQLSAREAAWLLERSTDRLRDFYRIWTAKEAYVKATGAGIAAIDLRTIDVALPHAGKAMCVQAGGEDAPFAFETGVLGDGGYVFCVASAPGVARAIRTVGIGDVERCLIPAR
ncbi:hypothetical protein H4R18_002718 [Coemansia javaensis]|uniref:holo-[acyl-carrier-protein] synthase n=1 Tax=Coemansia javaensis TaxID=2761396 RepID=A0A9W8HA23_9FUNG|nr:hypothetical protein H4R18_002718 [Coemansia javaensis]